MPNWPHSVDVTDYGMFNAVAFFEALSINKDMAIDMLSRRAPAADVVPSP
jgi:hypothetical protein